MFQRAFDSSYTGLTPDGARWLAERTDVRLVGIDYLSIAAFETCKEGHVVLFRKASPAAPPAGPLVPRCPACRLQARLAKHAGRPGANERAAAAAAGHRAGGGAGPDARVARRLAAAVHAGQAGGVGRRAGALRAHAVAPRAAWGVGWEWG
jgi:hypothetical protein